MEKMRIFVGASPGDGNCAECQMVFEYTLKKFATVPYELVWMKLSNDPKSFWHGWNTTYWSTPFSGFRYGIAEYCNYEGKAIYCDDDQLWLRDPLELWNTVINAPNVMTGKKLPNGEIRHCVSLIDCAAVGEYVKANSFPHASAIKHYPQFCDIFKALTFPRTEIIDGNWNNYDGEDQKIEDIKLLHFTDMSMNPGVKLAVARLGDQAKHWYDGPVRQHIRPEIERIFYDYYQEAIMNGYKVSDYTQDPPVKFTKQSQAAYRANNGWGS